MEKLKAELEEQYKVKCYVVTSDLSKAGAAEQLYGEVKELKVDVSILINNAGKPDMEWHFEMMTSAD